MARLNIFKSLEIGLVAIILISLLPAITSANVTATIITVTTSTSTSTSTSTVPGCPIHVPSTTTTIGPEIIFPNHIYQSNSSNKFTIQVEGTGFHQNSSIAFGYGPSKGTPNSLTMLNARTDCNGNWNATFHAPWGIGAYVMFAQDAQNAIINKNLVVTQRVPTIILPSQILPTNSIYQSKVNVTAYGFAPNAHIRFGYSPIPPFSDVMIDAITNGNGDWNGSFTAPWTSGSYNMIGFGSTASSTTNVLVVATTTSIGPTAPTTTISPI